MTKGPGFAIITAPTKKESTHLAETLWEGDDLQAALARYVTGCANTDQYVALIDFNLFGGGIKNERLERASNQRA